MLFSTHMHYTSTNYTVTPTMPVNDNEISIQRNATPTVPAEGGSNEISTQQQISPPSSLFWFKDEKSEERSVKQKMVEKLREINNFVGNVAFRESFINFNFPASEDTFQI